MPELPDDYRQKFRAIDIDTSVIEDILASPQAAAMVARILKKGSPEDARRIAFWMMQLGEERAEDTEISQNTKPITDEQFIKLSQMVSDNKLSSTAAKDVLSEMLKTSQDPESIAKTKNLFQVSDEGVIAKIVEQVLADNAKAAEDVKNGEMKAIGFLVGQVMKLSKGTANPSLAQELIKKQLGQ
ncbi:MAG TPA: Asp-tRNA(Asn)/Glu-tRNA(Gln) amidotransferase subunit GatB, partial [Methylomirabilota bacterium]|nr:Asp-tRNA(Asn)/Glu-tRNA(Gln) amidotransferase subunit GatB [Methylomirabilota bacterium]